MKTGLALGLGALVVAGVAIAAVPPQDAKAKTRGDTAAHGDVDHAAMMAKMMELGTPGPVHAELKQMVGTWSVHMKHWMDPGQPPQESNGTSHVEMANDRHLLEHFTGDMPGMGPYEGWGIMGFNNATQEFEHVWRDNMNTGMMWSTGTKADDGTTTMKGISHCAMGKMDCRVVTRMTGPDSMHFEMYGTLAGMPEMKMMEMDYTRGGAAR
jgi:hypothetical protein